MGQNTISTKPSSYVSNADEEEVEAIKEDKEKISRMQQKVSKSRPKSSLEAKDSTGVNAKDEEPIHPRMPNMPPA